MSRVLKELITVTKQSLPVSPLVSTRNLVGSGPVDNPVEFDYTRNR